MISWINKQNEHGEFVRHRERVHQWFVDLSISIKYNNKPIYLWQWTRTHKIMAKLLHYNPVLMCFSHSYSTWAPTFRFNLYFKTSILHMNECVTGNVCVCVFGHPGSYCSSITFAKNRNKILLQWVVRL